MSNPPIVGFINSAFNTHTHDLIAVVKCILIDANVENAINLRLSRWSGSFHTWISVELNRTNIKLPKKYTPADMKNTMRHSSGSVSSFTMKPTSNGATIDITLAAAFVNPINVPAKFGAMSMWLTCVKWTNQMPCIIIIFVMSSFFLCESWAESCEWHIGKDFNWNDKNAEFTIP